MSGDGDVRGYYAEIGVSLPGWNASNVSVRCFADPDAHSHEDRNASCSISLESGAFLCHACGAKGGAYDAALCRGLQPADAMRLLETFGFPVSTTGNGNGNGNGHAPAPRRSTPKPNGKANGSTPRTSISDVGQYVKRLRSDAGAQQRLEELTGITPEAVKLLPIGIGPCPHRAVAGEERIVFARRATEDGELAGLAWYQPDPELRGDGRSKSYAEGSRGLWPEPWRVLAQVPDDGFVFVVEGEKDAAAGWSLGLPTVGIPGVKNWRREYADAFRGQRVCVIPDSDPEGRQLVTSEVGPDLAAVAREVRVLDLDPMDEKPKGYSVSDKLREEREQHGEKVYGALSDFLRMVASSAPVIAPAPEQPALPEPESTPAPPKPADRRWPTMDEHAFHGLAGKFVRLVEPHSEGDPAALLTQFLVMFGNVIGRGPGFVAEGDFHATNLNVVIVGDTSSGKKGTSWSWLRALYEKVDEDWARNRVLSGLSTGEGLVFHVRDARSAKRRAKKDEAHLADDDGFIEEMVDAGVTDKRLLAQEGEFAKVLDVMRREGNTLGVAIRNLWDHGDYGSLTRTDPVTAKGAHISIVGHITPTEFRRKLTETDKANGFANRVMYVMSKRSKYLPRGGSLTPQDLGPLADEIREAVGVARVREQMARTEEAWQLWEDNYRSIVDGRPGMLGEITGRGAPHVGRLAVIYALLDGEGTVKVEHMRAALAVWRYCEQSAAYIFGDALGDPEADHLRALLRSAGETGLSLTDAHNALGRNRKASDIRRAFTVLRDAGYARTKPRSSDGRAGRPEERWWTTEENEQSDGKRGQS